MKTAVYTTHRFEKEYLLEVSKGKHELIFYEARLSPATVGMANGCEAVSIFVNDDASTPVIDQLAAAGVKYIVLRSAGYNHVDYKRATQLGLRVARVPAYSPYAVAEHAITLMLALNRRIIRAHNRVMELNFSLDGLTGFDMRGKTAGIIGTGKIGAVVAEILYGFGCRLLAFDITENKELKNKTAVEYTTLEELCRQSDIITLHCPLNTSTQYLINHNTIAMMKDNVMLINTSRGGVVKTSAIIDALKTGKIGYFGMDVYEEEETLFLKIIPRKF
jgi:D-lactate dehydrogenase